MRPLHTINNPAEMRRFIDTGVDNILTDRPDLLAEEMARMGKTAMK